MEEKQIVAKKPVVERLVEWCAICLYLVFGLKINLWNRNGSLDRKKASGREAFGVVCSVFDSLCCVHCACVGYVYCAVFVMQCDVHRAMLAIHIMQHVHCAVCSLQCSL